MKKMFIVLCLVLILIPLIKAEVQSLPTQKQGNNISIEQTCSNCTYVNVDSIKYPNTTRIYLNSPMAQNGYSYTYYFSDSQQIGTYIVTTCGDVDGTNICVDYSFEVTPTGAVLSTGSGIIIFLGFLTLITLSFVFFIFGIKVENITVKLFSFGLCGLFLVFLFGLGQNVFSLLLGQFSGISGSMSIIYILLIVLLTVGGTGLVLWLIFFVLNLWWKHRGFRD